MINDLLDLMAQKHATDLYLTPEAPPMLSIEGRLSPAKAGTLDAAQVEQMAMSLMNERQKEAFIENPELNLCVVRPGKARFRVNIYRHRGDIALVIRHIQGIIPSREALHLPAILDEIIMEQRGLVLFVGATSSGKSTTLASLIEHRKNNVDGHIITIEDPIEYVHEHGKSLVSQREIGVDTRSYDEALRNALRQAPDVILIGEIRSLEAMEHAIAFSETGHLCLSTLHANNANQALDRVINFFPEAKRDQVLLDLSFNLKAIVSQRLIPGTEGRRVVATEVLLGTPIVQDYIRHGKIEALRDIMSRSENLGMHTFDQDLSRLVREGHISRETALQHADSSNNLRIVLDNVGGQAEGLSEGQPLRLKDKKGRDI